MVDESFLAGSGTIYQKHLSDNLLIRPANLIHHLLLSIRPLRLTRKLRAPTARDDLAKIESVIVRPARGVATVVKLSSNCEGLRKPKRVGPNTFIVRRLNAAFLRLSSGAALCGPLVFVAPTHLSNQLTSRF